MRVRGDSICCGFPIHQTSNSPSQEVNPQLLVHVGTSVPAVVPCFFLCIGSKGPKPRRIAGQGKDHGRMASAKPRPRVRYDGKAEPGITDGSDRIHGGTESGRGAKMGVQDARMQDSDKQGARCAGFCQTEHAMALALASASPAIPDCESAMLGHVGW